MSDVAETLEELAAELADGRMTSVRLVNRSLERVARLDGRLNSFVAMDEEGKSAVAPFLEKERFDVNGQKLPMSYPIWIGTDEAADKFGGILGYPTSFLISRDGKQVRKFQGLKSQDELEEAIESQL